MGTEKIKINNRKKPVKTWKKLLLFAIAQLMIVSAVLCCYLVLDGGRVFTMQTLDGSVSFHMDSFEEAESFEDSTVFHYMMEHISNDIMVLSVVRSQMETEGVFDGKKKIDITDYVHRRDQDAKEAVSAVFYLEDLLKWSKYGLEYTDQFVRIDGYGESERILEDTDTGYYYIYDGDGDLLVERSDTFEIKEAQEAYPNQSVSSNDLGDENGYYTPSVWMKQSINYYTRYANYSEIYTDEEGRTYGNVSVLKCRYQTADGRNLEELVNNWEDYFTLTHNLEVAISNLNINYNNYQILSERFDGENTNLKYCIRMNVNGKETYVSNLEEFDGKKASDDTIMKAFTDNYGKYLYYCPADMEFETNTSMYETIVFNQMTSNLLEYAYPENTKIWMGVDTSYPIADSFAEAKEIFDSVSVPAGTLLIAAAMFAAAYILILIILCWKAGWEKNEGGDTVLYLNTFDRMHTEFVLIFAAFCCWLLWVMWSVGMEGLFYINRRFSEDYQWTAFLILGAVVTVTSTVFGCFLLSLVRRIKGRNLLRDTFIGVIYHRCKEKWMESIRENQNSMLRNVGVYLAYLLINFVLVVLAIYEYADRDPVFFMLFLGAALVFDIWVGYILIRNINERFEIVKGVNRIREGEIEYQIQEEMHGENQILADAVNNIGDGLRKAVETSMKDERMKADLITNVSHDIKTPLTSIINYVDLMKREDIPDEKIRGYIEILDSKSQRLKQLTEDLVEASKISSGNISYVFERINLTELVNQAIGEFSEKFEEKQLTVVDNLAGQTALIEADSRRMWRVIENLFNNIYKYALGHTRIYLTLQLESVEEKEFVSLSVKNISAQPLNIEASELTERFIRGDISRSTEGSGLGLSIAKQLTEAQHGKFDVYLDGDLFKVTLTFPILE